MSVLKLLSVLMLGEGPFWDHKQQALLYVDIWAGQVLRWDSNTQKNRHYNFGSHFSFVNSWRMSVSKLSPVLNLGEGPFWDHKQQALLYVDIYASQVLRWDSSTQEMDTKALDKNVSFVIPHQSNWKKLMVGVERELRVLDWDSGETTTLAQVDHDLPASTLNDGKCDSRGRLWAGTVHHGTKPELLPGTLYTFDDGKVPRAVQSKVGISNGIEWSLDDKVMFFIDSFKRSIDAFDYDIVTGNLSNRRVAVDFQKFDTGYPDGMTRDADGNLWVASFGSGRVIRFDPQTGKEIQHVKVPSTYTTSCCFGGPDFQDLFVTSASANPSFQHLSPTYANTDQGQRDGFLYRISGLGVKGLPANYYEGK